MEIFEDSKWYGRLIPHSVYSLKRFWPTLFYLHGLKTSLFPKRLWGKSKNEVASSTWPSRPKMPLVLLWVRLVPKAGASKKLQPAVYQRRCPTWVLFSSPALNLHVNGMLLGQGLGLFQSLWNLQYVFIWNDVLSFIQEANFLSAYMWDSVLGWSKAWCCYPRGLWVLDARILYWGRVLYRGSRLIAHHL